MGVRGKQWLVATLGFAVTVAMLGLGLWQMRVFENKEDASALARAAQPAVPLLDFVTAEGTVGDVYGKQVWATGRYLPNQQLAVVDAAGNATVLSALLLVDGRVLPVLRGRVENPTRLPSPETGETTQTGVFLPSQPAGEHAVPPGTLPSVRLPLVAQAWPQQLIPGYITLEAAEATRQGMSPAAVVLPGGEGALQNAGYALQWWAFAAFAAFMTLHFVRTIGKRGRLGRLSAEEDS